MLLPSSSERKSSAAIGWKGLALPAIAFAGAVTLLVHDAVNPRVLLADSSSIATVDQDMDGLPDSQEIVMGTNPGESDSDGDGYSDLEELARHSDPLVASSVPEETAVNIGLTARTEADILYVSAALYLSHTETSGIGVEIGVMVDGVMTTLPTHLFLANASITIHPAKEPGDFVAILQTPYPADPIEDLGAISFWSIVTPSDESEPSAADAINLRADPVDGTLLAFELEGIGPGNGVYRPIADTVSGAWEPGQICVQSSLKVGNIGPIAQHLIESAACSAADGYCTPGCSALSGTSFQMVDPLALLGG